ncbi:hypothetical protein D3C74_396970 [compost metagenome]
MVGDEGGELVEPPQAELGQDDPLVGDARRQDVVERAHAVTRDDQDDVTERVRPAELREVGLVEVADLPRVDVPPPRQVEVGRVEGVARVSHGA